MQLLSSMNSLFHYRMDAGMNVFSTESAKYTLRYIRQIRHLTRTRSVIGSINLDNNIWTTLQEATVQVKTFIDVEVVFKNDIPNSMSRIFVSVILVIST